MSVKHVRAVVTEEHFTDAVQVHQEMCLTPNSFCWVNERPETDLRLPREAPVQRRWVNERPEMDLRLPREAPVQRRWVNERPEMDLRLPRETPVQRRWVNERPEMDLRLPREASVQRRCCGSCQCWENCYSHGTCCLGLYPNFVAAHENTNTRYGCIEPLFLTSEKQRFPSGEEVKLYWMVSKCDSSAPRFLVELCENPGKDGDLNTLVPVTKETVTYRNKYCALCNEVDFIRTSSNWQLDIHCETVFDWSNPSIIKAMEENKCEVIFVPPTGAITKTCEKRPPYYISTCNVTGQWQKFDEAIDVACRSFVDAFNLTYRNYFCYLCNTAEPLAPVIDMECQLTHNDFVLNIVPPFSALVDLDVMQDMNDEPKLSCDKHTQFEDKKLMLCRDIVCGQYRYLSNGMCRLDVSTSTNENDWPCVNAFIKLTPQAETKFSKDTVDDDDDFIWKLELNLLIQRHIIYRHLSIIQIYYKLKNQDGQIEYLIVRLLIDPSFHYEYDTMLSFVNVLHNAIIKIDDMRFLAEFSSYRSSGNVSDPTIYVPVEDDVNVDTLNSVKTEVRDIGICMKREIVDFRKTHVCPYVKVSLEDIPMAVESDNIVTKETQVEKLTFSRWEFKKQGNDILICSVQFQYIYELMIRYPKIEKNELAATHPKQILALVCVCLSVACLFITLVIYGVIKELQTQPGINNVTLCLSLLLSQCFYQFGVGQRSLSSLACTLIGVFSHFFWLTVMFSMNACCIQMFLIFRRHTHLSSRFDPKLTLKYLVYITSVSLILVCVNVALSLVTTVGEDTGYGGTICYISTSLLHILTFIIPSATTIAVNVTLFCYTVFSISKTKTTSAVLKSQERNYFAVYARLSTLTGLTWIFGYLFILLKYEILEYLFIIFNASQGVFIMIAFVLNKRVIHLICGDQRVKSRNTDITFSDKGEPSCKTKTQTVSTIDKDIALEVPDCLAQSTNGWPFSQNTNLSVSSSSLNKACQILGENRIAE